MPSEQTAVGGRSRKIQHSSFQIYNVCFSLSMNEYCSSPKPKLSSCLLLPSAGMLIIVMGCNLGLVCVNVMQTIAFPLCVGM